MAYKWFCQCLAATKIASVVRGFLARKHFMAKRQSMMVSGLERFFRRSSQASVVERDWRRPSVARSGAEAENNRAMKAGEAYRCGKAHVPVHGIRRGRNEGNSSGNFWISEKTRQVLVRGKCFNRGGDQRWGVAMYQREYCPTSEIISKVDAGKTFLCRCRCDPLDYL